MLFKRSTLSLAEHLRENRAVMGKPPTNKRGKWVGGVLFLILLVQFIFLSPGRCFVHFLAVDRSAINPSESANIGLGDGLFMADALMALTLGLLCFGAIISRRTLPGKWGGKLEHRTVSRSLIAILYLTTWFAAFYVWQEVQSIPSQSPQGHAHLTKSSGFSHLLTLGVLHFAITAPQVSFVGACALRGAKMWRVVNRRAAYLAEQLGREHTTRTVLLVGASSVLLILLVSDFGVLPFQLDGRFRETVIFSMAVVALQASVTIASLVWVEQEKLDQGAYQAWIKKHVSGLDRHIALIGSGMVARSIAQRLIERKATEWKQAYVPIISGQWASWPTEVVGVDLNHMPILTNVVIVSKSREDFLAPFMETEGVEFGVYVFGDSESNWRVACPAIIGDVNSHAVQTFARLHHTRTVISSVVDDSMTQRLMLQHAEAGSDDSHWVLSMQSGMGRQYEIDAFRRARITLLFPFDNLARVFVKRLVECIYRQSLEASGVPRDAMARILDRDSLHDGLGIHVNQDSDFPQIQPVRKIVIVTSSKHFQRLRERIDARHQIAISEVPNDEASIVPRSYIVEYHVLGDSAPARERLPETILRKYVHHRDQDSLVRWVEDCDMGGMAGLAFFLPDNTQLAGTLVKCTVSAARIRILNLTSAAIRDERELDLDQVLSPIKRSQLFPQIQATLGGVDWDVAKRQLEFYDEMIVRILGYSAMTGLISVPDLMWGEMESALILSHTDEMPRFTGGLDPDHQGNASRKEEGAEITLCIGDRVGGYLAILLRFCGLMKPQHWFVADENETLLRQICQNTLLIDGKKSSPCLPQISLTQVDHKTSDRPFAILRANATLRGVMLDDGPTGLADARTHLSSIADRDYSEVVRAGAISAGTPQAVKAFRHVVDPALGRNMNSCRLEPYMEASNWALADAVESVEECEDCPSIARCPITAAKGDIAEYKTKRRGGGSPAQAPFGGDKRLEYISSVRVWGRLGIETETGGEDASGSVEPKSVGVPQGMARLEVHVDRGGEPGRLAAICSALLFQELKINLPTTQKRFNPESVLNLVSATTEPCDNSKYSFDRFHILKLDELEAAPKEGFFSSSRRKGQAGQCWYKMANAAVQAPPFVILLFQLFPSPKTTFVNSRLAWSAYMCKVAHFLNHSSVRRLEGCPNPAMSPHRYIALETRKSLTRATPSSDRTCGERFVMPFVGVLRLTPLMSERIPKLALAYSVYPFAYERFRGGFRVHSDGIAMESLHSQELWASFQRFADALYSEGAAGVHAALDRLNVEYLLGPPQQNLWVSGGSGSLPIA